MVRSKLIFFFLFLILLVPLTVFTPSDQYSEKGDILVSPLRSASPYDYNQTYVPTYNSKIQTEELGGSGASILPNLAVGESNETHTWIVDPTNQTEGYYVESDAGYFELNSSRGQTYRHWYNETSGEYTYSSDYCVNKTGVIENTDWVTEDEYPSRFILRLTNGSIRTFETPAEISTYLTLIDNSTIWGVGYESFEGVMGFYLNFQDTNWGHAQYVYWPRLLSGQITAYNQPLYAIYPHLYVNYSGTIYDKLLNDRSLYTEPYQNPRNTLHFYNTSDTFGLYFTTYNIQILSSTWNFVHGFKYNFTDNLYHLITRMECTDRSFDDIGMGYEITSSPQSDGTPYQPERFVLSNETHSVTTTIQEAWEAGTYLDDFYSRIEIISQNNESFIFTFSDMEDAGFTEKYLNLHDQQMPDGSTRKTLRAGMYGYGSYTQNTWLEIDPDTGNKYTTDNYDLCKKGSTWNTDITVVRIGIEDSLTWDGFIAYNTGIEVVVLSITSNNWQGRINVNYFESDEGVKGTVYNIKGNADGNTAKEDSQSYSYGTYYSTSGRLWEDDAGDWFQADATETDGLLEYWADWRDSNDEWISFHLSHVGAENEDYLDIRDTQSSASYIQFVYTVPSPPDTPTYYAPAYDMYASNYGVYVTTQHTDPNGQADVDDCRIKVGNSSYYFEINYNVDSNAWSEVGSSGYLWAEPDSGTETSITNGYRIGWQFAPNFLFPFDDLDWDLYMWTDDEGGLTANSGWVEADTHDYENELIVKSVTFQLNDTAFSEDGNTGLTADEWFRGGAGIRATGTVVFEGTTFQYPAFTSCDVQLWTDGTDRGEDYDDDELAVFGTFTTPYYPTTTGSNDLDTVYGLDVTLTDFVSGASEGSGGVAGINVKRDNQIPTGYSIALDSDTASIGYAPNTGYYDDNSADCTVSGESDGSGSGFPTNRYTYQNDGNDWGAWSSDSTPSYGGLSDNSHTLYVKIRDKVGNNGTAQNTGVIVDTDSPTGFTLTWERATGTSPLATGGTDYHAYLNTSTTTIYFRSLAMPSNYFNITVNDDGTIGDSGFWKIEWDKNSVFETGVNDTSGLPDSMGFTYSDDSSGTFIIRLINNAGNYQDFSFTATLDNDPITPGTLTMASGPFYADITNDSTPTVTPSGASDSGSGLSLMYGYQYKTDGGDWVYMDRTNETGPYTFTTIPESDDVDLTLDIWDMVGNGGSGAHDWNNIIDLTDPSFTNIGGSESSVYLYAPSSTTDYGYYSDNMGATLTDFNVIGDVTDNYGLEKANGTTQFSDTPQDTSITGTSDSFSCTYTINNGDQGTGDVTITIYLYDQAGNVVTDTFTFYEDNTNPIVYWLAAQTNESSAYLYYDDSSQYGYYSDNMEASLHDFNVGGNWTDASAGVYTAIDNTTFGNDPSVSGGALLWTFTYSIDQDDDSSGSFNITFTISDNCYNNATVWYYFYLDNTNPTATFDLFQDSQALVSNYYHTASQYTNATSSDGSSGLPTNMYSYQIDSGGWSAWTSEDDYTFSGSDQSNHTLYLNIRDNVGNIKLKSDWVWVDMIAPVLGWLTLNESWAPNWYDQSVSTCAQATIGWTETYVYHVNVTCALSGYVDDLTPSGSVSYFNFTLTGAPDGSYSISVIIYDKAGNTDTTLLDSEAPIQLESGMSSETNIYFYYFYYFRSDGIGLSWSSFNTTFVLDEDYREYTEEQLHGISYAVKYWNSTSIVRIITRDYFGVCIHNQSYTLAGTYCRYITLSINSFKVCNLYSKIMDLSLEYSAGGTIYTEHIMPYEIFRWDLYETTYNVTVLIHGTSEYAEDEETATLLNDFSIDLTSGDISIFIDKQHYLIVHISTPIILDGRISIAVTTVDGGSQIYINDDSKVGIEVDWENEGVFSWYSNIVGENNITIQVRKDFNEDGDYTDANETWTDLVSYHLYDEDLDIVGYSFNTFTDEGAVFTFISNHRGSGTTEFRYKTQDDLGWSQWLSEDNYNGSCTFDFANCDLDTTYNFTVEIRAYINDESPDYQYKYLRFEYTPYAEDDVIIEPDPQPIVIPDEPEEFVEFTITDKAEFMITIIILFIIMVLVMAVVSGSVIAGMFLYFENRKPDESPIDFATRYATEKSMEASDKVTDMTLGKLGIVPKRGNKNEKKK